MRFSGTRGKKFSNFSQKRDKTEPKRIWRGSAIPQSRQSYIMTSENHQANKPEHPEPHKHEIVFFIDKQRFVTDQPAQTPTSLLQFFAGEDPTQTTLVLKEGHELHKYTDPNEPITLHEGMRFVVFHNCPTPVS